MRAGYRLLNGALLLSCLGEYRRFASISSLKRQQEQKLLELTRRNRDTEYGKKYGFSAIRTVKEYQQSVPITTYEDYRPYLEKISHGRQGVLTREPVLLLEPTGGSTSGSKLIPYTQSLREEMQRGVRSWMANLYSAHPGVMDGKSYWSVTPAATRRRTPGGIPIGFDDDAEYFGGVEKHLLRLLFTAPPDIARERDMDHFYFRTALALLECESLALISVWNPTFLLLLLEYMEQNRPALLAHLPPERIPPVARGLRQGRYDSIWPGLRVISCWCDAESRSYAQKLHLRFPGVTVQPKGLLATECFVSFPLAGLRGGVLSARSHFFEFCSLADGRIYLAHQLRRGESYEMIVSTGGGFYRYRLRDVVRIMGHTAGLPRMEFLGRAGRISDLFGEKLQEDFVAESLRACGHGGGFALVAPETDRYVLYTGSPHPPDAGKLDALLRRNFHYDYCRKLGQLKSPRVYRVTGEPERAYIAHCVDRGQRLGDIKPTLLARFGGWERYFSGYYTE